MIKYLGSKRSLLPAICRAFSELDGVRSVIDLFSGTARVGHALKQRGYQVFANDHNRYAAVLARCYVESDAERWLEEARGWLAELSQLPPAPGWFTRLYCEEARFFHPKNGGRIEAIRERIAAESLPEQLEAILLTSLMEAADRVDSTVGVQMAYLKRYAARAHNDLELRLPELVSASAMGPCRAFELEALDAAQELQADAAYLDPPYNQHKYLGNYHIWETLARWDRPEVYGMTRKRMDAKSRRSAFNSKPRCAAALKEVLGALQVRYVLVSFSSDGFLSREQLLAMLGEHGKVEVQSHRYPRYVGARIGIHSPSGEKVGRPGALENEEQLFVLRLDEPRSGELVSRNVSQ
ncbi:MAG: DNA methyltransferase [Planctomycetota bacterium]|nr:MAG: DNA methyltransferase [Planctomycetota bacterium]